MIVSHMAFFGLIRLCYFLTQVRDLLEEYFQLKPPYPYYYVNNGMVTNTLHIWMILIDKPQLWFTRMEKL